MAMMNEVRDINKVCDMNERVGSEDCEDKKANENIEVYPSFSFKEKERQRSRAARETTGFKLAESRRPKQN